MPYVKLQPLSPELEALTEKVRKAFEGAHPGQMLHLPKGLWQAVNHAIRDAAADEIIARRRLEWLHSEGSNNVDGWEWGIYRVKYDEHGQTKEMLQTRSDFSDLDAAMDDSAALSLIREEQAAPPTGDVVVTKNEAGQIVFATRQDSEGRILSVIAEAAPPQADWGDRTALDLNGDSIVAAPPVAQPVAKP